MSPRPRDSSPLVARIARPPERLVAAVREARKHEQEIGEPVEIDRDERIRRVNSENGALSAPADGAREVKTRRSLRPAGENKALQRLELGVRLVDLRLEPVDVRPARCEAVVVAGAERRDRRRGRRARSGCGRAPQRTTPPRSSARRRRRARRCAGRASRRASRRRGSSVPCRRRRCRCSSGGRARSCREAPT